jgi:hypothetical protein
MSTPISFQRILPSPYPPQMMGPSVWQLGLNTRIDPITRNVLLNYPLIESLVKSGASVIQPLYTLLNSSMNTLQIIEGLYLAQRLAEEKAPQIKQLYMATTRFHYSQDPLIQIYLAGFYRKLKAPETFGPMASMFLRQAQYPFPQYPSTLNPLEEMGGTLLQQIAEQTADVLQKRGQPLSSQ